MGRTGRCTAQGGSVQHTKYLRPAQKDWRSLDGCSETSAKTQDLGMLSTSIERNVTLTKHRSLPDTRRHAKSTASTTTFAWRSMVCWLPGQFRRVHPCGRRTDAWRFGRKTIPSTTPVLRGLSLKAATALVR